MRALTCVCVCVSFTFKSFFFFATHAFIILSHTLFQSSLCIYFFLYRRAAVYFVPAVSVFARLVHLPYTHHKTRAPSPFSLPLLCFSCFHSIITIPSLVTSGHVFHPPPAGTPPQTPKWHASPWLPRLSSPPNSTRTRHPRQSRGGTS